jgi:hypothetical protein
MLQGRELFKQALISLKHGAKEEDYQDLRNFLKHNKFTMLGAGSTRTVFSYDDDYVLKIPGESPKLYSYESGVKANLAEYLIYKRFKNENLFASCDLFFFKSIPILLSERVSLLTEGGWINEEMLPKNSKLKKLYDGYQVGKNKNGNLICFDYGLEYFFLDELPEAQRDFSPEEYVTIQTMTPDIFLAFKDKNY